MVTAVRNTLVGVAVATAGLLGSGIGHAGPMEWAWIGPYDSLSACEQDRSNWPVASDPCVQRDDGVYFWGLRQASS